MKKTVYLETEFNEMANVSEVIRHIGADRYDAIKREDDRPMFVLLRVGYEGVSTGSVTIANKTHFQKKMWSRKAIDELAMRLNEDPGVFVGNHSDRGKPSRERKGDVLSGHPEDDDDGKRSAFAVAYISDLATKKAIEHGELDVCSVEGEIVLMRDGDLVVVEEVKSVSGVVISNGEEETPGFERAGIEAVVAELTQDDDDDPFLKDNPLGDSSDDPDDSDVDNDGDPFLKDNPLEAA